MRLPVRWGGLRAKIIAWSFVPTAIILTAVALVAFYAYQQVTQDLTIQSSRELARLSAGQFAGELTDYSNLLTALARTSSIYDQNPAEQRAALAQASNRLFIFDGGVVLLDHYGTVVAAQPARPDILGHDWSRRDYFKEMVRAPGTVVSNVVNDGADGAPVVLVAVPVTNTRGELVGMLAGMFRVGAAASSTFYGSIVKLRFGEGQAAYLVDRNGLVIYHTQGDWIGKNLNSLPAVQQVTRGQADAQRTRDAGGREIVASFAPVPGTPWGLVKEDDWEALLASGRRYQQFLLVLLALGVFVPTLVVTIGVNRITNPIARLIAAAQEIAGGKFGQEIHVSTGDELEELVKQFNRMSAQLSESYARLEERVAARTRELATLNSIAAVVSSSLHLSEVLNAALSQATTTMRMEVGTAYTLQDGDEADEDKYLVLGARVGLSADFVRRVGERRLRGTAIQLAAAQQQPIVWLVENYPDANVRRALELEGVRQVINVPLLVKGKLIGAFNLGTRQEREVTPEELSLLASIGQQIAVAVENANLYDRAEKSAALAERHRLSRELHDSVTQSLYSVTLYAEATARLLAAGETNTATQYLRELRETAQEALREMRLLIFELRPLALEKTGLETALRARLDAVEVRGGMQTELQVKGEAYLPPLVQDELYHIAHEALNNILKHAHAQCAQVRLIASETTARLDICDDGVGFASTTATGGLGLAGMKERVDKLGGTLHVQSAPGKGTTISVEVPLNAFEFTADPPGNGKT